MHCLIFFIFLSLSGSSHGHELAEDYEAVYAIYQEGSFSSAKEEALKLLPVAKQENNAFYLVKLYFLLGYLATHTDDHGNAILYYLDGARIAEVSEDKKLQASLIGIYKNLGRILGDYEHYKLSHKFIDRGLRLAVARGDNKQIKSLLNNRINELLEEERYHEALKQIDSLQSLFELNGEILLKMKNKAGIAYQNLGELELAMENYTFVLDNGRKTAPHIYVSALQNTGSIYLNQSDYEKSLSYFHRQIAVATAEGLNQLMFQGLELAGESYFLMEDYNHAIDYLNQAVVLDEAGDLDPDTYTVYSRLSRVYKALDDIDKALHYQNIYTDRLEKFIAQQAKISEFNRTHNIQLLAQKHLDLLIAKDKQQEVESKVKVAVGMAGVILLLLGLGIYYRHHPTKA